jgi:hypothetical protein
MMRRLIGRVGGLDPPVRDPVRKLEIVADPVLQLLDQNTFHDKIRSCAASNSRPSQVGELHR